MQTRLADFIRDTPSGREADAVLRKCVHCGFCNATCPTYELLGDELDGPRGRIYLIKQVLEGSEPTRQTQLHLDRCLTCRACETTCPSGVEYGRLLDIGRALVDARVPRRGRDRTLRWVLRSVVPRRGLFALGYRTGRFARGVLPRGLKEKLPEARPAGAWPEPRHSRRMFALAGCVQASAAPVINAAAARVLDALGISLQEAADAGCCGALRFHLDDPGGACADARRNIDAWWPQIENGEVEALVMTASGCGVQVRDYAHLLGYDPDYAERAARIAAITYDLSEIVAAERDRLMYRLALTDAVRVAFQAPCTLQHGQRLRGVVESVLGSAGFEVLPVADAHMCCGSAGAYSLLQPELAEQLRERKLHALQATGAEEVVTANIGCLLHLQGASETPVRHWIELLDERLVPA